MADDEKEYSEEEEDNEGAEKEPQQKASEAELAMEKMRKKKEEEEAYWVEYLEQRKKQRAKEEDELRKLKERQVKRKERRKEEEKNLIVLRKQQEEQRIRDMEEKKARDAEAKRKRLEEAERKRQAMQEALQKKAKEPVTPNYVITRRNEDGTTGTTLMHTMLDKFADIAKTKEQLLEDKKIALSVRVKPLQIEGLNVLELRQKAQELWEAIVRLESEKYDLEERRKRQEYDLKELSERQKQINRSNALKKGLDPDALSGKYPPMIQVASKYERRLDRRSFHDKKSLYEGGLEKTYEKTKANQWEEKLKNFQEKGPSRLLKWDPSAPKVKEDEKAQDDDEEGMPSPFAEGKAEAASQEKKANEDEEEEEEEEEDEEEEEE